MPVSNGVNAIRFELAAYSAMPCPGIQLLEFLPHLLDQGALKDHVSLIAYQRPSMVGVFQECEFTFARTWGRSSSVILCQASAAHISELKSSLWWVISLKLFYPLRPNFFPSRSECHEVLMLDLIGKKRLVYHHGQWQITMNHRSRGHLKSKFLSHKVMLVHL